MPQLLSELWRIVFKVDAKPSFGSTAQFGLWQSPTGLYFFDPGLEGDHDFYMQFYRFLIGRKIWAGEAIRNEFQRAATRIRPGDRVLDVGCGAATFQRAIPQARYVGLDPTFAGSIPGVLGETLADHLRENAGAYDAVCAFQVIEHLSAPVADVFRHGARGQAGRAGDRRRAACAVGADAHSQFSDQCAAASCDLVDEARARRAGGALRRGGRDNRERGLERIRLADLLGVALFARSAAATFITGTPGRGTPRP